MKRSKIYQVLAAVTLSAAPVSAAIPDARELTTTAVIKGPPSGKPGPDIYYLAAEAGAKETYTLTTTGPASITLFTPDGHELVSASGSGKVTLVAYPNLNDVFILTVARVTASEPYTLSRQAILPTLTEAGAFAEVGYTSKYGSGAESTRCWITPGVKLRVISGDRVSEATLAADHTTMNIVVHQRKASLSFEQTRSLVGNSLTVKNRASDGQTEVVSSELPRHSLEDGTIRKFSGYLCSE
jgi:hypothetical protein